MNLIKLRKDHPDIYASIVFIASVVATYLITHGFDKYFEEKPTLLYQDNSKWKVTCYNSGNKVAKEVNLEVTFDQKIKNRSVTFSVPRDSEIESNKIYEDKIFELKITRLHSKFPENQDSKPEEIQVINNDDANSVSLVSLVSDETRGVPDPSYKNPQESDLEIIDAK